jgi:hypothetical protein
MDDEARKILEKIRDYDPDLYHKLLGEVPSPPKPAEEQPKPPELSKEWQAVGIGLCNSAGGKTFRGPAEKTSDALDAGALLAAGLAGISKPSAKRVEPEDNSPEWTAFERAAEVRNER